MIGSIRYCVSSSKLPWPECVSLSNRDRPYPARLALRGGVGDGDGGDGGDVVVVMVMVVMVMW